MAKYLGGIKDPNIEVVGIAQHFFDNDFDVQYYDYKLDALTVQKHSIAKSVVRYEEVTAETWIMDGSLPWNWIKTSILPGTILWAKR